MKLSNEKPMAPGWECGIDNATLSIGDGSITISDTLTVTGATSIRNSLTVRNADNNADRFTVAQATGNTAISGTLGVSGATTLLLVP